MKKFYSLVSFILCVCIIISPMTVLAQDNIKDQQNTKLTDETFEIAFVTNLKSESNNPSEYQLQGYSKGYSNIKIDVYASEITAFDPKSGISEFTHSFKFSAYTDKNGVVAFTRPSDNFLVLVDL